MIPLRFLFVLLLLITSRGVAEEVHTPAIGSSERQEIINVLRHDFYQNKETAAKNPKKIVFLVKHLRVKDGWACVNVQPIREGVEEGEPGWTVLRRVNESWESVDYLDKLFPFESEEATLDALDMKQGTVDKLLVKLLGCPKEIFP